ncbi:uncharacterized protein LOC107046759 [Diachasma alloeum]|uniref:uncharacterized protein LOC107046759 n=1 Tax=Diachasma alloeum TaxID=454923 RepID=UPI0007384DAE|nr:uncharacterized protein LOC107046759 [Diachasma alloeum]XP_015124949.1 uncharacterized protein LOC107046759 [Diachasma alloeum]
MTIYHGDFSLCRLAAIAVSKQLWRHSALRDAMESCIRDKTYPGSIMPRTVTSVLNHLILSKPVKDELMFAVGAMGSQILDIFNDLEVVFRGVRIGSLDQEWDNLGDYMEHIHWIDYKFLDIADTLRSLYFSNCLPVSSATWAVFCRCCLEDCIIDLWGKLPDVERIINWRDRYMNVHYGLEDVCPVYWMARMQNELDGEISSDILSSFRIYNLDYYDPNYQLPEIMFLNAFVGGNYSAFQYFWKLLDDYQKIRIITNIGQILINCEDDTVARDLLRPGQKIGSFFILFFLQKSSLYNLDDVKIKLLGFTSVLKQLLECWPYENLFLVALRESADHNDTLDYATILCDIFNNIHSQDRFLEYDVKYRMIFYELWAMKPKNLKKAAVDCQVLVMLQTLHDVNLYNHILRDEELVGRRKEILNLIMSGWFATDTDFHAEFVEKVLISPEEKLWFRCQSILPSENRTWLK